MCDRNVYMSRNNSTSGTSDKRKKRPYARLYFSKDRLIEKCLLIVQTLYFLYLVKLIHIVI